MFTGSNTISKRVRELVSHNQTPLPKTILVPHAQTPLPKTVSHARNVSWPDSTPTD